MRSAFSGSNCNPPAVATKSADSKEEIAVRSSESELGVTSQFYEQLPIDLIRPQLAFKATILVV